MRIELNPDISKFDQYVLNHPHRSVYQTSAWSSIKQEWECVRLAVSQDEKIVGVAQILIRKLPLGKSMFYIPRGPLWDVGSQEVGESLFKSIIHHAKKEKAIFVKFDPNHIQFIYDQKREVLFQEEVLQQYLSLHPSIRHLGFKNGLYDYAQPRFNAIVHSDENLLQQCSSSTRRNVKIALKKDVVVSRYGPEGLEAFSTLIEYTEQRKNVALRNRNYFERFFDAFSQNAQIFIASIDLKNHLQKIEIDLSEIKQSQTLLIQDSKAYTQNQAKLESLVREHEIVKTFIEKYGDKVDASGLLVLIYGDTCEFLYSGVNTEFSKFYATYLMRLTAMEYAKEKGCTTFNFGGIPGTLDDGLWEFKRSFGAQVVEYVGEFDLPISRFWYMVYGRSVSLFKKIRSIRNRK